ncbi:hypothetical protein [Plesiomonas shigelloides]|uniref:hypothetical protein n=1 Tax=Plesiomonas shigelloides TaxID=703 RepID=UPI001E4EC8C8|nr:hypothetical protein [Plesiomonas shigelloides]
MSWDSFVFSNIKNSLIKEGFSEAIAVAAATDGLNHYLRQNRSSKKNIFDECLIKARQTAKRNGVLDRQIAKRPTQQNKQQSFW